MATGDRNYNIAKETTSQEILSAVGHRPPTKIETIEPEAQATISRTGKGKLFIDCNGSIATVVVDGVTLVTSLCTFTPFDVEFTQSFSITRGNTTSELRAIAVFY